MKTMNVNAPNVRNAVIVRMAEDDSAMSEALRHTYPEAMAAQDEFARNGTATWGQVKANTIPNGPVICEVLVGKRFDDEGRRVSDAILDACDRVRDRYPTKPIVIDEAMASYLGSRDLYEIAQTDVILARHDEQGETQLPRPKEMRAHPQTSNMASHILTFSPMLEPAKPFDPNDMRPIENIDFVKPEGGGWLSVDGGWERWAASEMPKSLSNGTCMVMLRNDARILEIRDVDDLNGLPVVESSRHERESWIGLDFEKLAESYDGMYVDMNEGSVTRSMYKLLYGWDASSVVLFNPDVVEYVSELKDTPMNDYARINAKCEDLRVYGFCDSPSTYRLLDLYTNVFGNMPDEKVMDEMLKATDPQATDREPVTTHSWVKYSGKPTKHESITIEPVPCQDDTTTTKGTTPGTSCVVTITTAMGRDENVREYALDDEHTSRLHKKFAIIKDYNTMPDGRVDPTCVEEIIREIEEPCQTFVKEQEAKSRQNTPTIDPKVIDNLKNGLTSPEEPQDDQRPAPSYTPPSRGDNQKTDEPEFK